MRPRIPVAAALWLVITPGILSMGTAGRAEAQLVNPAFDAGPAGSVGNFALVVGPPFRDGFWGAENSSIVSATTCGTGPRSSPYMLQMNVEDLVQTEAWQVVHVTGAPPARARVRAWANSCATSATPRMGVQILTYNSVNGWPNHTLLVQSAIDVDNDPATWQEVVVESAMIPSDTQWILVHLLFVNSTMGNTPGYVDDVELTLDNCPTSILRFSSATSSISEGAGLATITVARAGCTVGSCGVSYATANGSATAGVDYVSASGTLSWPDGDASSRTFSVPILDDAIYEGNETVLLSLTAPTGDAAIGSPGAATLTIVDNGSLLKFSSASYSVSEAGGLATITVTRTGSNGACGVSYATANGSATAGVDYVSASGALSWPDGDTSSRTFSVPILDDAIYEGNETVLLSLTAPTGEAAIGSPGSATLTIQDNPDQIRFSAATYSVAENGGSVTITVTRAGNASGPVGVSYSTAGGSAAPGVDYVTTAGTLSWPTGDTSSRTFSVPIMDDGELDLGETFTVSLSSPTGEAVVGSPGTATVTIQDDEFHGYASLESAAYNFYENSGLVMVSVLRTGSSSGDLSVDCSASGGTAIAGSDYGAVPTRLHWENGDTSPRSFKIVIYDDSNVEGDEALQINLSNPRGGLLGSPGSTTLTIVDNDPVQDTRVCGGAGPKILLHLASPTVKNACSAGRVPCANAVVDGSLYPSYYYAYVLVAGVSAADGIAGVQLGIEYGSGPSDGVGVDIWSWTLCAAMEFGEFGLLEPGAESTSGTGGGGRHLHELGTSAAAAVVASGGSNLITWNWTSSDPLTGCQRAEPGGAGTGVVAVAGYFYTGAYSPARLSIIPRPVDNLAAVASCPYDYGQNSLKQFNLSTANLGSAGFAEAGYNPCLSGGPTVIAAPATCSVTDGEMSAVFTWSAVPGATYYLVYRDNVLLALVAGSSTSYEDFAPPGEHVYSVKAATPCSISESPCSSNGRVSDVDDRPAPHRFALLQPANPARSPVEISFELPAPGPVRLAIFSVTGRLVQVMAQESSVPGRYSFIWNGRDQSGRPTAQGMYFVRLAGRDGVQTRRFVLLR